MARVAVLAGGRSPEREVSLRSGRRVAAALAERGHEVTLLDPADAPLVGSLASVDACYLALHGREGEDGTVQRLLELLGVPYTGSAPLACALAFDKLLAKEALRAAGIATPRWAAVEASALRDLGAGDALPRVLERVGLPAVVKPARGGSALGVREVERATDLPEAVMGALAYADAALVEARVRGVEVAVGIVGSPPETLPPVEIRPESGRFDYAARYTFGATEYFVPARLDPLVAEACQRASRTAFDVLGLRDVARADLIVDEEGTPWLLEVNVSPGMTETSLLPMAAGAAGLGLPDLCDRVLAPALARGSSILD
jgi:D-alanine-D-alanine ligase